MNRILTIAIAIMLSVLTSMAQPENGKYYHIVNVQSGKALTNGEIAANDQKITVANEDKTKWGQVWQLKEVSANVFCFVNPTNGAAIDIAQGTLLQWTYSPSGNSAVNQRFYLKTTSKEDTTFSTTTNRRISPLRHVPLTLRSWEHRS